ncbi:MAG TPA: hypothetical protein VMO00_03660 [Methylomirabilota bacterium]|nr:hypothetical protein [Methylomirabilota bacterium]
MESMIKWFVLIVGLCAQLSFAAPLYAEMWITDGAKRVPNAEAKEHPMALVSFSPLLVEGNTVGKVLVYDDPTTKRPADYFELYDSTGDLVAIGWFDRFGIRRMTLDLGFLDGADDLEGVFVSVVGGDSI